MTLTDDEAIKAMERLDRFNPTEFDLSGWIPWKGGDCPVADETLVEIKCMGNRNPYAGIASSFRWSWVGDGGGSNIAEYRILEKE